jgi:hypothetical protein
MVSPNDVQRGMFVTARVYAQESLGYVGVRQGILGNRKVISIKGTDVDVFEVFGESGASYYVEEDQDVTVVPDSNLVIPSTRDFVMRWRSENGVI